MKTNEMMAKANLMAHRAGVKIQKHSPEILLAGGIIGIGVGTFMMCKATLKLNDILDEAKETMETINEFEEGGRYSSEDAAHDRKIVYAQTGMKLVKLYGPAFFVETASIVSILASYNVLKKRNVALSAALMTVEKGFREYRDNVIERFGQEVDKELLYGIKKKEVEVKSTDENGNETTEKKEISVVDHNMPSPYARFFDESARMWRKDANYNKLFLHQCMKQATIKLHTNGYLFLNDVYEMLGMEPTQVGAVCGWVYNPKDQHGDDFVDFGIYDDLYEDTPRAEAKRAFINEYERCVLLDFNCVGSILEYL